MDRTRIKVLLVDDDEEDYLITADVMAEIEGTAFEITWRSSFDAAVEALATGRYDLLVFDYRLGAETGIDLLRHAVERGYPAPVILLTGQQDTEVDNEAIRLGAADYLIKGKITPDSFARAVRHAMEKHRVLTQLRGSNAFLQSIIDALPEEIAILDAAGRISMVNHAWQAGYGACAARQVGARYTEWTGHVPDEELEGTRTLVAGIGTVLAGESAEYNLDLPVSAEGRCRWAHARATSFVSGENIFAVVAYEDITVRKLAEAQLRKSRERLQELSIRDELTGLYNRRYFNGVLKDEAERSRRYGKPFAVMILDIDHFKAVNDTYGHATGDTALRHIARIAREECRTTDCAARYGGEEFAFVLPETGLEEARQMAERMRLAIESAPLPLPDLGAGAALPLTASLGVAVYPASGETPEAVVEYADKGLYLAKREGRNRVGHAGD